MNEVQIETRIERAPADVFAALVDLERSPMWNPGLTEVRRTSDGPLGVGSTIIYVGRFLGRSYSSPATYTHFAPGERLASRTTSGPFELEVDNVLEAVGDGTRVRGSYRGESRGFFALAEPIVLRLTRRHFENVMANLKELLEARAL